MVAARAAKMVQANEELKRESDQRKRAEQELEESKELYRALVEAGAHIGEAVILLQNTDKVEAAHLFANQEWVRITGYSLEELTEISYFDLIHPRDRDAVAERNRRRLEGEDVPGPWEISIIAKDGTELPVEATGATLTYQGRPAAVGYIRDVTERKKAEEELKESEGRYRAMAEAAERMGEAIVLLQNTDKVEAAHLFANQEWVRITGYSLEELTEISYFDLIHPRDRDGVAERNRRRLKGEDVPSPWEISIMAKDGTELPVEGIGTPITYEGRPAVVAYIRDISERKRAEAEREALLKNLEQINRKLEQSNQELQDFAYIASHDLREPLRKIASFGKLLQVSLDGKLNEDEQENFEFMVEGAGRMRTMIDDLLAYSRITTRAKPFENSDLNKVIADLKSLELATLLDETKGSIRVPKPLPPVRGDLSQIRQLFQNLVGNGLKFHLEGVAPEITIRAHQIYGNMVKVEVRDNGIGIAEEYHKQVFTMFKRLHSREHYAGTGIGLAVCQKIVGRHGGSIGVKSTPGEGSTFWFTLPSEAALDRQGINDSND